MVPVWPPEFIVPVGDVGFVWICAASAADAHARLTQLKTAILITISCRRVSEKVVLHVRFRASLPPSVMAAVLYPGSSAASERLVAAPYGARGASG